MLDKLINALIFIMPAYISNSTPVIMSKLIRGGKPIDFRKVAWNGRRLFGNGKTIEGFISGIAVGSIFGMFIFSVYHIYVSYIEPIIISTGALTGDLLGSFIKRRLGMKRGDPAPLLDQLDFLITALMLDFGIFGRPKWFSLSILLTLILITVVLHIITNFLAYLLKLKKVPW